MADFELAQKDVALMEHALRLTSGFGPWPAGSMQRLLAKSRVRRFARHELVGVEAGEPWTFTIISGHVIVSRTPPRGPRAPVTLLGPGSLIGLVRLLENTQGMESPEPDQRVLYDFSACLDTTVVQMPTALILQFLDEQPALWRDMAVMLMKQHRQVLDTLLGAWMGSFSQRLASTLERLAMLYGSKDGSAIKIGLRITQEDLAALLQVTRQSVNKALRKLAESGAIGLNYNSISVLDLKVLRSHASAVP
ncbi:cAMP-binding domain of CRP or a regulatory subunit of cAMP-dependent protein kinases [Variovorax sp. YR750]|uniref:Crp/Fnr family transcriptional regulator n=1 Tax=Variovorax sp. YR750 TaxID=1884384 RepID=UPI0008CCEF64|nr:Crp/Fnr family transcriptional regulator [Variovorax sp. YR750]SEM42042.1 cAMP-binding domain of CRP or a regulatory subunit of cAMP-dependent protein kinases [Variovorax sp. YR750]